MADRVSPDVARARFAAFVERALRNARLRGMSDREIQKISGVATSTFHRWRLQEIKGLPKLPQVRAFCEATGASLDEAIDALGMSGTAPVATPEQPIPREISIIMRRLLDPSTPEREREFIQQSLELLAARATVDERAERSRRNAV